MSFFNKFKNNKIQAPEVPKRGRGRPPKNPPQQGSELNTQIVQNQVPSKVKIDNLVNKKMLFTILIIILVIIPTFYFYTQNKNTERQLEQLKNNSGQQTDESKNLTEQVGKLVLLPADEQPTIASVSDVEKLKGQAFFANAQAGDKVLVYNQAKRAILYRPSINKIIEMAPLNSEIPGSTP